MTPQARSTRHLTEQGYHVAIVERRIPRIFITKDVWNWGDLLAVHPQQKGAVLIQVTSGSNFSARLTKLKLIDTAPLVAWLLAGNQLVLHAWRKLKTKGRQRWTLREHPVTLQGLASASGQSAQPTGTGG